MALTTAISDIVIADRGGGNPKTVPTHNLQVAWEVNRAGTLSAFVMYEDLLKRGISNSDLRGKWVSYTLNDGVFNKRWGGPVMSSSITDGEVEIAAYGFEIMLYRRNVSRSGTFDVTPGGLLYNGILGAATYGPTFLNVNTTDGSFDLSGRVDDYELDGTEDVYETIVPLVTEELGYEWAVDPATRKVYFGRSLGLDLTASVRLSTPVEINTYTWVDDLFPCLNHIRGDGLNGRPAKPGKPATPFNTVTVEDQASIDRFGVFDQFLKYTDTRSTALVETRLTELRNKYAFPKAAVTLTINNDTGAWFRVPTNGYISVNLGSGITGQLRIRHMAIDTDSGMMTVSGEGVRR